MVIGGISRQEESVNRRGHSSGKWYPAVAVSLLLLYTEYHPDGTHNRAADACHEVCADVPPDPTCRV